ncbi:TRAP transporter substrate-binding protein [Emcibacter sp.]|uniref:TRAP transporter substrate-binding protein n=1 Tax=Emcibacter sp. TaxID=1979954 RepID=UPI003A8E7F0D
MTKPVVKYVVLFLCMLLVGSCRDVESDKTIVIKFSHVVAPNTPKGRGASLFKELVEKRLPGRVVVEVYPSSQLMGDDESLEALAFNDVQMTAVSLSKYNRFTTKFQIFDLPFLFDDQAAVKRFFKSPEGQSLLNVLADKGFKGLGFWPNGMKQLGAPRPLKLPTDAAGLKFRIMESDVLEEQFLALKANPQKMAFREVYQGLQTGTIDGQENTWSNIWSRKFFEVQPYITESNHGFIGYAWMVNTEFWDSLPPDVRAVLETIVEDVNEQVNKMAYDLNQGAREKILEQGSSKILQLTPLETKAWKKVMTPVWDQFAPVIGEDLIAAALRANGEDKAPPENPREGE